MIRVALTILLPLLAPTAIYFLWLYTLDRAAKRSTPWRWLAIGGLVAAGVALVVVGVGIGGRQAGPYVPAHVENGHVVPGEIAPLGPR